MDSVWILKFGLSKSSRALGRACAACFPKAREAQPRTGHQSGCTHQSILHVASATKFQKY